MPPFASWTRRPPCRGRAGRHRPPTFTLVDLGSSNGSFLRIRGEVDLVPGDHFRVGQQLFRVDFEPMRATRVAPGDE